MPIFDYSDFYYLDNLHWSDSYPDSGGSISNPNNGSKIMYGSGVLIDKLGFIRNTPTTEQEALIFQIDVRFTPNTSQMIMLCGIGLNKFLNDTNCVTIMFNAFQSDKIRMNDYGENKVAGSNAKSSIDLNGKYTCKLVINEPQADAYLSFVSDDPLAGTSFNNFFMGTSVIAQNFTADNLVYFSTNQTFMNDAKAGSIWSNFYVHTEGFNFVPPKIPNSVADNFSNQDYMMKEYY